MPAAVTITRLEKAAADNGFDLDPERTADWLRFGSMFPSCVLVASR